MTAEEIAEELAEIDQILEELKKAMLTFSRKSVIIIDKWR